MEEAIQKANALVEALPYIQRFRGKRVVIKFGGSAMSDDRIIREVLEDAVFLATVGIRPVIVHGGGQHISDAMDEAGMEPDFVAGHRRTDEDTLDIAVRVLAEEINSNICHQIQDHGASAIPGFQDDQSVLRARKKLVTVHEDDTPRKIDIGYVGEVVSVDIERLDGLSEEGDIVVLPPIGQDHERQLYNVNADSAAAAVARATRAEKIVFLSDVHGIMERPGDPDSFLPSINRRKVDKLIEAGTIQGGMLPKIKACLQSIASGVRKAHIIDASLDHSLLLEIFTDAGIGTQIVDDTADTTQQ
ncbi:MAG: acetylglutamate kinase [Planctomycetota bacterium]